MTYLLLILGFVLLIKGADFFVDGSSNVARLLRIPSVIIGLTIVAFGTSLPEASVSITAAMDGANELALSNVIGSNLFNLLIVVGACAVVAPMPVTKSVMKKEFPFTIVVTAIILIMSADQLLFRSANNVLSQINGVILLALFVVFLTSTIRDGLKSRKDSSDEEVVAAMGRKASPLLSGIFIIGGLVGIVVGGNLVVSSATDIALSFGLSQTFIGLTIVALGTSLPELVTSVVASRRGENDIALGNVVGSNLFNLLFVLASSASLHPVGVNQESMIDLLILIVASLIVWLFGRGKSTISRREGAVMLAFYAGYFVYITIR